LEKFQATYFDGESSRAQSAAVTKIGNEIFIQLDGSSVAITWPIAELRLTEEVHRGQPARFQQSRQDPSRLIIDDPGAIDEMLGLTRPLRRRDYRHRTATKRWSGSGAGCHLHQSPSPP
jgi:hypothetical protein